MHSAVVAMVWWSNRFSLYGSSVFSTESTGYNDAVVLGHGARATTGGNQLKSFSFNNQLRIVSITIHFHLFVFFALSTCAIYLRL